MMWFSLQPWISWVYHSLRYIVKLCIGKGSGEEKRGVRGGEEGEQVRGGILKMQDKEQEEEDRKGEQEEEEQGERNS